MEKISFGVRRGTDSYVMKPLDMDKVLAHNTGTAGKAEKRTEND